MLLFMGDTQIKAGSLHDRFVRMDAGRPRPGRRSGLRF